MADEETKKDESTDETTSAEDTDASAAGPPAEEESEKSAQDDAPEDSADEPAAEQEKAPEADQGDAPADEVAGTDEDDDTPWKAKRRLEKSRRPHQAGPKLSPEERAAKRLQDRRAQAAQRRKTRATAKGKHQAGTGTPAAELLAGADDDRLDDLALADSTLRARLFDGGRDHVADPGVAAVGAAFDPDAEDLAGTRVVGDFQS